MSYSEQVKQNAKAAADYIREHGWCQFTSKDPDGRVCARGAIGEVTYERNGSEYDELSEALIAEIGHEFISTGWNDTEGRTKEEVLAVFDRIANS